jgi:hypothetical protein
MVSCTARAPSGFEREVGTPLRERSRPERGRPGPADAHYLMITLCCCLLRAPVCRPGRRPQQVCGLPRREIGWHSTSITYQECVSTFPPRGFLARPSFVASLFLSGRMLHPLSIRAERALRCNHIPCRRVRSRRMPGMPYMPHARINTIATLSGWCSSPCYAGATLDACSVPLDSLHDASTGGCACRGVTGRLCRSKASAAARRRFV